MRRVPEIRHPVARLLAGRLVAAALGVGVAGAQVAPAFFEIAAVEHDPSGRVVASLAIPEGVTLEPGKLTALLDGVPRPVSEVTQRDPEPISVVVAIDVSGSMRGSRLAAAQEAALDLIERLRPDDLVAVVAFADAPRVVSNFTTDREATTSTLRSLVADGATTLYGAVDSSAQLLMGAETQQAVLVLLTDGEASTTSGREESVETIADTGAAVFSFALGPDADVDYLGALAERTGGQFRQAADEQALEALFAGLGRRLGADVLVTVAAPPLAIGEYQLTLRFAAEGELVESGFAFEVTNVGLIVATVTPPPADDDEIVIQLQSPVPLASLSVETTTGGQSLPFIAGTGRILVDPWAFNPGPLDIEIRAMVGGRLAAETTVSVEVPRLDPRITLQRRDDGGVPQLVVSGRAQGPASPVLRVLVDGEEQARSEQRTVSVPLPTEDVIEVRLEDQQGSLLKSDSLTILPPLTEHQLAEATGGGAPVLPVVFGMAVAIVAAVVFLMRRRAYG